MITKEQSREEIKKLVEKYNKLVKSGKAKSYNEEMTKKDFILPLFRALGWSVEDGDEVTAEEKISKGRVDYAFRIEGIPKLFLEAKSLREDLDKKEFAEQAINYAWHKGATWAILTDFEGIKVFNAEWKSVNYLQNQFFLINCNRFLDNFEQLWLLSRESLELGLIDKEAEKWGKKAKKIPVDKQLLSDLTRFRELLTKNILKNNSSKNLTEEDLEEAVQRIIDRLIFIRTLEDKQLEAPILQSLIRENTNKRISKKLNDVFRKIDDVYNSKLFTPHLCEELAIDDDILEKIIYGLFKTADNTIHYDFSDIDADVLGNIYEQYLGHILKKTAKRASLTEGKAYRKEQGIYYTPIYVVDYIVKNTIGELAKDKKFDLKNIKVLDPACGSGSFLMKAFDYLVTLDKKKNGEIAQTKLDLTGASASYGRKVEILKENIFGVDLDSKAVEIAQLNLLLKTAEKKHRLPTLQENIKVGNSLIDDPAVAGDRAFKWEEQFKDVMKDGGFDVVIGNPPYGAELSKEEQDYLNKVYDIGSTDTAILFIKKANELLKKDGKLGFIVPKALCFASNYKKIREFIWDNVETIVDCGKVWKEVKLEQVIFILSKGKNIKQYNSCQLRNGKIEYIGKINKNDAKEFGFFLNGVSTEDVELAKKIKSKSIMLNDISTNQRGAILQKFVSDNGELEVIGGAQVQKFGVIGIKGKINKSKIDSEQANINDNSILVQRIVAHIENPMDHIQITCAIPSDKKQIIVDTINQITLNEGVSQEFVWCLLNSKLVNWYAYRFIFGKAIRTMQFDNPTTSRLPIPRIDKFTQNNLKDYVKEIFAINKKLDNSAKNSDNWKILNQQIGNLLNKINQEIYRAYNLTAKEVSIIEESLK